MTALALLCALLLPAHAKDDDWPKREGPGPVTEGTAHYDLEKLYFDGHYEQGMELAKRRTEEDPTDPAPYWHIARFMFEIGERFQRDDDSIDKVAWYREMLEWSEKGLEHDPEEPHLLFAKGIAKARLGTTRGVLSSLFLAKDVEQSWLKAALSGYRYASLGEFEVMPCDVYLSLGIFYRVVPEWWIVKVLSGTRGDLDASVKWLEKANECLPNRIGVVKELGVAQLCYGQKRKEPAMEKKGRGTLIYALSLKAIQETDFIDHKHINMLLGDEELACEYSRDGQQDLDRESLDEDEAAGTK